jgi:hypothetical protein
MKSQIKFSQFAVLMLLVACNNSQKLNYSIKTIDLESNIGNFREISLSQINAEINYLPLLNNEKTGIDRIISMDVSSDFILVNDYKQCLLYDKSGKQIAKIYEKDRSENEKGIIMGSSFGPQNTIYIQSSNGFLEFDHNGKYLKTIDFNKEKDPNYRFLIHQVMK